MAVSLTAHAEPAASPDEALVARARGLRLEGEFRAAKAALERLSALRGPVQAAASFELARVYAEEQELKAAIQACRRIDTVGRQSLLAHACAAETYAAYRRGNEALASAELALAKGDEIYEAKVAQGVGFDLGLDEKEAEASLREAIGWQPARPEAHAALGRLFARMGRIDDAMQSFRKALALEPRDATVALELARVLPPSDERLALAERAVKGRRNHVAALVEVAELKLGRGDSAGARTPLTEALRIQKTHVGARLLLARVALAQERPDEAYAEASRALDLLPNSAAARLLVADALARRGDIEKAIDQYQATSNIDRTDPTPLFRAVEACLAAGRPTSARAFAERTTREFPTLARAWEVLGDVYTGDGDPSRARAAYERALREPGADRRALESKLRRLAKAP
jgi:tetratricopeptide (TPR) repeat protein